MFRTVPLSIIRSFSLYTQQWYMSANLYDIYHCCVYSKKKAPDDGQRKCPKYVEFYSKNKFEKLVHLVGFIIRNEGKISKSSVINLLQCHFIPHKSHKEWFGMRGKNPHNYRLSYGLQPPVKRVNQYIMTTFLCNNTFVLTVRFLRHFCVGSNRQLSEV